MTDWLAEIEARVPRACIEEDGTVSIAGVVMLRPADYDWLVARVRALDGELTALLKLEALHRSVEQKRIAALEAQAALDAKVREALGKKMVKLDFEAGRVLQELGFTYVNDGGQRYWSEYWYTEDDEAYEAYRLVLEAGLVAREKGEE